MLGKEIIFRRKISLEFEIGIGYRKNYTICNASFRQVIFVPIIFRLIKEVCKI